MALIDKLTAIADAIRGKTGGTEALTLDQMATEIEGIETGGGGDTTSEDGLVTRTLTEYTNDRVKSVAYNAFRSFASLQSVTMKNCAAVETDAFNDCTALKSLDMPNLVSASTRSFRNTVIEELTLPLLTAPGQAFASCKQLVKADFTALKNVPANMFNGNTNFTTLILRNTELVTLANVSALTGTAFATDGTGGTVYVPESLIESYQTATNWSSLYTAGTCNFVAIEGSEYE